LADKVDGAAAYFSQISTGRREMGEAMARRIERRLGLPPESMDRPFDPALFSQMTLQVGPTPADSGQALARSLAAPDAPDDNISIPLLDVRASAGLGEQQPDHDPMLGTLRLSIPWMHQHLRTITSPTNLACLFAYGPSMEPTFGDGSILIVDVGVREVKVDAIYVLQRNDELYVKRLQRRLDGTLLMISDNPHFAPETLTPDGKYSMAVLGRVVWAFDSKGV
jgi:hypothetical protein